MNALVDFFRQRAGDYSPDEVMALVNANQDLSAVSIQSLRRALYVKGIEFQATAQADGRTVAYPTDLAELDALQAVIDERA